MKSYYEYPAHRQHYDDVRDYIAKARWHLAKTVELGLRRRRDITEHQFAAMRNLFGALRSRDLARAARRAATTQPAADSGETKETR
jgi:CRISPR/Cas system-associated protein endoribonuclease Cas2